MRPHERIPLHDHADLNSGGKIDANSVFAVVTSGGSGATSGSSGGLDDSTPAAETVGTTGTPGTHGVASRGDHRHAMPSAASPSGGYGTAATGSAATVLLSDAVLPKPTAADVDFSADVTTNNVTTGHHGLAPKLSGSSSDALRGDGSWAAVAPGIGVSLLQRARIQTSVNQSIANGSSTSFPLPSEVYDSAGNMAYQSDANLTGTVAKTSGSAALTGSSTHFTTELSVGQLISVPGTATELRVVTAITDDTHLTVSGNFANTASGQTAKRVSDAIVITDPAAANFIATVHVQYASNSSGERLTQLRQMRAGSLQTNSILRLPPVNGDSTNHSMTLMNSCQQWDWIDVVVFQSSGGSLNVENAQLAIRVE